MHVTNTVPPIKYITRPRPISRTYVCDQCPKSIVLYVRPSEVLHKCPRTRRWTALKAK